jgi:hypothetical protein
MQCKKLAHLCNAIPAQDLIILMLTLDCTLNLKPNSLNLYISLQDALQVSRFVVRKHGFLAPILNSYVYKNELNYYGHALFCK